MKVSFKMRSVIGTNNTSRHSFSVDKDISPLLDLIDKVATQGPFIFSDFQITLGRTNRLDTIIEWVQKEVGNLPSTLSVIDCLDIIDGAAHVPKKWSIQNSQHVDIMGDLIDRYEDVDPEPPLPSELDAIAKLCSLLAVAPVRIQYRSVLVEPDSFHYLMTQGEAAMYIYKELASVPKILPGNVVAVGKKSWSAGRKGQTTYYRASPPYGLVIVNSISETDILFIVDISGTNYETDSLVWRKRADIDKTSNNKACTLI